ncbi:MAG TPA: glycerophosphodiester phosphodiesterase [Gaiellaceae bacterium]|nr:glycerophosphodiester phosphodiesterase [Gaiellaceae bacterium]
MRVLRPAGSYWKVAHRGASALGPENSLEALELALEAGIDMVELDVVSVAGDLRVAHSLPQLRPESPRLDETLALFAAHSRPEVFLDLDVKDPGCETVLVERMRTHGLVARTLVTSFHPEVLRSVRKLEPAVTTGLSYPNDRYGLSGRAAFAPFVAPGLHALGRMLPLRIARMLATALADAAMLHHALVTTRVVRRCHAAGAAVFAWTVEGRADLERVLAAGADGVIANDPTLFDG